MKDYKIKIKPITGVHIGNGNELTPIEYKLDEKSNKELVKFSHYKIISNLVKSDRERLIKLIDISSKDIYKLKEIIKLLHMNIQDESIEYTERVDSSFVKVYRNKLMDINNQLIIKQTYRSQNNHKPVIPGSSLKGAIRTALLNYFIRKRYEIKKEVNTSHPPSYRKLRADEIEKKLLHYNDSKNDPLRTLIVADCKMEGNSVNLVTKLDIYKRKYQKLQRQQMFYEIITGELLGGDASGISSIKIDDNLLNTLKDKRYFFMERNLTVDLIKTACNSFYKNILAYEYEKFYRNASDISKGFYIMKEKIENELKDDENKCILRVGRFSQVESITFPDEFRNIKARRGYGNTRTLAIYNDVHYPIGWIVIDFLG